MDLGFIQAGFRIVGAWDFDKYAIQSYKHNIGDHVKQADISQMTAQDVPRADVWTFGFPCQDISIANIKGEQREKLEGARSGLFYEVMRLLDETQDKPTVILAENVEELGPLLPIVEKEYDQRGYHMKAILLNSKDFGVPQNRPRYFVAGFRDKDKANGFDVTNPQKVTELLNVLDEYPNEKLNYPPERYTPFEVKNVVPGQLNQVGALSGKGWLDILKRVYSVHGISPTLNTCQGGHRQAKIYDPRIDKVRKLSATEYGKLQGFPDTWEQVVSDSQAYKQFGNAVSVPVAQAVAESIAKVLKPKRIW